MVIEAWNKSEETLVYYCNFNKTDEILLGEMA